MDKKVIKVYTTSNGAELNISAPSVKQTISATNNRAQYFAEQAKKYRDEAKYHRDNAQYYAEQNSDVTIEYVNTVKANLEEQIASKQNLGDYALRDELPQNVSELENDAQYINNTVFATVVEELKLPSEEGRSGCFLSTDGKNKSWVDIKSLNKQQITNCLLEVPQNIKLELNNGTLTLKKGSKVIVPNGAGVFKELIISKDLTLGTIGTATLPSKLYVKADGSALVQWVNEASGATVPASGTFFGFYNTSDNTCKLYNADGTVQHTVSFPIANVHRTSGSWDKIEQVFNGFGYIGSHIWMDKGVKVLVANGINDDGTIKNEEIVTPNVIVARGLASGTRSDLIPFLRKYPTSNQLQIYPIAKANFLGELDYVPTVGAGFQWYFNTREMKWYMHEAGATEWVSAPYYNISPTITVVNNVITSFQPYKPFRAVDYDDYSKTVDMVNLHNKAYITETYVNGTSWYRMWSDGWCEQGGQFETGTNHTITFLKSYITEPTVLMGHVSARAAEGYARELYPNLVTKTQFTITNANVAGVHTKWYACGYTN